MQLHSAALGTHCPFQHRCDASTGHRSAHSFALDPHVPSAQRAGFAAGHGHAVSFVAQLWSQHLNGAFAGHDTSHWLTFSTHRRVSGHRCIPSSGHGQSISVGRQLESRSHCTSLLAHRRHSLASVAHVPDAAQKYLPVGHTGPHAHVPAAVFRVRHRADGHFSPASYASHDSGTHRSPVHAHSAVVTEQSRSVFCIQHVSVLRSIVSPVAGSTLPTAGMLLLESSVPPVVVPSLPVVS